MRPGFQKSLDLVIFLKKKNVSKKNKHKYKVSLTDFFLPYKITRKTLLLNYFIKFADGIESIPERHG